MKSKRKTYRVEYWTCNVSDHRHKSEAVANRCITKLTGSKAISKAEKKARDLEILDSWFNGESLKSMEAKYGLRVATIRDKIYSFISMSYRSFFGDTLDAELCERIKERAKNSEKGTFEYNCYLFYEAEALRRLRRNKIIKQKAKFRALFPIEAKRMSDRFHGLELKPVKNPSPLPKLSKEELQKAKSELDNLLMTLERYSLKEKAPG